MQHQRRGDDRGASLVEYLALVAILAVVLGGVASLPLGAQLGGALRAAVCQALGPSCPAADAGTGDPGTGSGPGFRPGPNEPPVTEAPPGPEDIAEAVALLEHVANNPEAVAELFANLDPDVAAALAEQHPDLLGNLDGVPPELRYAPNRVRIAAEADRLRDERAALVAEIEDADGFVREVLEEVLAEHDARIALLDGLADPDRQILLFDPEGDGRIAEVLGDLETADHVAFLVPGVGNDLENFESGLLADAQSVQEEALAQDPGAEVAVVATLNYDPPGSSTSLDAARGGRAEGAAEVMPDFVLGVDVHLVDGAEVTVIGHSYGSVAVSLSAQAGMGADSIVFIGSPGIRADHVSDLGGADVYAGESPADDIRFVPNLGIGDVGHGHSPVDEGFGADVFGTGPVGHSEYYDPGTESLENIVRILLGNTHGVTGP